MLPRLEEKKRVDPSGDQAPAHSSPSPPEEIRAPVVRQGMSVRSDPDFNNDMARLIAALQKTATR